MRRTFLRQALVVLAACAASFSWTAVHAQGASFQLVDTNCSDFTLSGPVGARVLTCVPIVSNNPPSCVVTGSSSAALGSNLTLTASCAPAATSYAWTQDTGGTGCSSSTSVTCSDSQASNTTVTYKVTGTNANGPGPQSPAFPVAWSNTVVKPSGCSVTNSPGNPVSSGTSVSLTVNCSNGTAPFTYAWTGGPVANQTTNPAVATFNSASSGNVTVTNSAGSSSPAWSVSTGGGGGNIDTSACTALGLNAKVITVAWGSNTVVNAPTMGPNDALIIQFTTSSVTTATGKGTISAYEYAGPTTARAGALSASPCDFSVGLPKYQSANTTWFNYQNPSFSFTLFNPLRNYPTLAPNTTYYLNITNFVPAPPDPTGTQNCNVGNCPMQTTLTKPSGS